MSFTSQPWLASSHTERLAAEMVREKESFLFSYPRLSQKRSQRTKKNDFLFIYSSSEIQSSLRQNSLTLQAL